MHLEALLRRRWIPCALIFALTVGCVARKGHTVTEAEVATPPSPPQIADDPEFSGLKMRLSDAPDQDVGREHPALAQGEPLSDAELQQLLSRLPPLEGQTVAAEGFNMRPQSPPPPRPGSTVKLAFPPENDAPKPAVADGPVEVLRFGPEGDIAMAPNLSVTFNQPMVAVGSVDESSAVQPVSLDPQPAGKWRWIGTRTLLFEPEGRFPMSTAYRVTIPAGTASALGNTLPQEKSFEFRTPMLTLKDRLPEYEPVGVHPIIVAVFNQAIDAEALLPFVQISTKGAPALRLATEEEIAADRRVQSYLESAQPERVLALSPVSPLNTATGYTVVVAKGAPSAEGPRLTESPQSWSFGTYSPLRVTKHQCGWSKNCSPQEPWWIEFNNGLDAGAFDPSMVTIDPPLPTANIQVSGAALSINGWKTAHTEYTVTLPASLEDIFAQTLGKEKSLEFKVGAAEQAFWGPSSQVLVLDPSAPARVAIHTTNHKDLKVRIRRVSPEDWAEWQIWAQEEAWNYRSNRRSQPPGKELFNGKVKVEKDKDALVTTWIDLEPYLKDGHGQFALWVEPSKQPPETWNHQQYLGWVQVTDIGLTAFVDSQSLTAWATSLKDGAPLKGVDLSLGGGASGSKEGGSARSSDARGLATLELPTVTNDGLLIARRGSDLALLPQSPSWWSSGGGWVRSDLKDTLSFMVFDDRGLYRPGETVKIKGWVRRFEQGVGGGLAGFGAGSKELSWLLYGAQGNELASGTVTLSAMGGFDLSLELPDDANLGQAGLELRMDGSSKYNAGYYYQPLRIEEFRRPEFEVTATTESGPFELGRNGVASVQASYFAGGALPSSEVTWRVYAGPGSFVPPTRSDYQFGPSSSPWFWGWGGPATPGQEPLVHSSTTDAKGAHRLQIDFLSMHPPQPTTVRAEATVMDVNRQAWTATTTLLVHPSDLYLGLKAPERFVDKGDPLRVQALAVDRDGNAAPETPMTLTLSRMEWGRNDKGQWAELAKDPQVCRVESKGEDVECSFKTPVGGRYRVVASLVDSYGRPNETRMDLWVAGAETAPNRRVDQELVQIITDKDGYAPGETARLLIQSPFSQAHGLLTLRRQGLMETRELEIQNGSATVEIDITEEHIPNLQVGVDLVGAAQRVDDDGLPLPEVASRPAYAAGQLGLTVSWASRALTVVATPQEREMRPGSDTAVDLRVTDSSGRPVAGAEVSLLVVDEAVLALTGKVFADPMEIFYALRTPGVYAHHLRALLELADPNLVAPSGSDGNIGILGYGVGGGGGGGYGGAVGRLSSIAGGGDATLAMDMADAEFDMPPMEEAAAMPASPMPKAKKTRREANSSGSRTKEMGAAQKAGSEASSSPIRVRTRLDALALFAPAVTTDSAGQARVDFTLPDSLTRYRVVAVVAAGDTQFGKGESSITAREALMVRPSLPRFLNFGDRFELSVTVQNPTELERSVAVGVRVGNLKLGDGESAGQRVLVPPKDRVEVRFPASAGLPGTAVVQAVVASGSDSDATRVELPIWTPATTEAFATYGTLDEGATAQPVQPPKGVYSGFGGLEISTSSTTLQTLTDAFVYLMRYPFECNEQRASRILAVAALKDVLQAFEADGLPSPEAIEASMSADLRHLEATQDSNGGWSFWRRDGDRYPYLGIHVAHALVRAEAAGYRADSSTRARSLQYLRTIESHIPYWYSEESKRSLRAYALYVRELWEDASPAKAKALVKERGVERLNVEVLGWLLPTLNQAKGQPYVKDILHRLGNAVAETAAAAHFVTSYSDGAQVLLHSDRRADAILLDSLIRVQPKSDLIPKLVEGLLGHRTKGRWISTQENAFVLLAMNRYFHVYEGEEPNFVARVWLGEGYAGEHAFEGRSTERARIDIPMAWLQEAGPSTLTLQRDGDAGRLYYRIGMRYAPKNLDLEPFDAGFAVERVFEAVDDPEDVWRDDEGTWHVRSGKRVRIRLTMVAEARRHHVALVGPFAAGLEPENPALATSGTPPADDAPSMSSRWWWWGPWFKHQNLRDDRVEAFTDLLWDGVYTYSAIARATTPGSYVVPPAKAEEMYHPETFGRSASDRLVVE